MTKETVDSYQQFAHRDIYENADKCDGVDRLTCRMTSMAYEVQPEKDDQGETVGGLVHLWPLCHWFKNFHKAFELGYAEADWLCYKRPNGDKGWKFRVFYEAMTMDETPSLTVDFPHPFDVYDVTVTDDNTGKMYKLVPVMGQVADGIDNHWYQSGFETGQQEMANHLKFSAEDHMRVQD